MQTRRQAPLARVLVVDDEELIRDTLAEVLSQERFAVSTAADGESALRAAEQTFFDVVLCDVSLPGIDGLEVLERLLRVSPETSVILITAYATVESAVEAFQRGAHDYLMKPIILDEVIAKIHRILTSRELLRDNAWLRRGTQPPVRPSRDRP
jgi:DNA-binding NtrC family response regulator